MVDKKNLYKRILTGFILCIIFFPLIFILPNFFLILIIFTYTAILFEVFKHFKQLIIYPYLLLSFVSFIYYFMNFFNKLFFIYIICLIILFDTFSYFFGSFFGKNKILPFLSPNKTYEGFIYGLIITLFFGVIFNQFIFKYDFIFIFIFILIVCFSSFIGDLIESYFKRRKSIKNSSSILPGHGGLFDRFDSYIFVFIIINFLYATNLIK